MEHIPWKRLTNPNYLGAYAFDENKDMILTINDVKNEVVVGENGKTETCVIIYFKEKVKPLIANKTNLKTIEKIYKTPYIDEWKGRSISLYVDHNIRFGKEIVDGVRIRPTIPKVSVNAQKEYKCVDCNKTVRAALGRTAEQLAQYTQNKYGKCLCVDCAKNAAVDKTKSNEEALSLSDELTGGNE